MKRSLLGIAALAVAVSLTLGLNTALAANWSAGRSVTVAVTNTVLGRILVDGRGRTLYLFERDKHGTSTCSGLCASEWPPVIASGKPLAGAGAQSSLLGVTKRGDGRLQVTYNHHPLYTFVNDTSKGQTSGEQLNAFGAEWYVLSKAGVEIAKAFPTTNNDGSEPSSGGYGY